MRCCYVNSYQGTTRLPTNDGWRKLERGCGQLQTGEGGRHHNEYQPGERWQDYVAEVSGQGGDLTVKIPRIIRQHLLDKSTERMELATRTGV